MDVLQNLAALNRQLHHKRRAERSPGIQHHLQITPGHVIHNQEIPSILSRVIVENPHHTVVIQRPQNLRFPAKQPNRLTVLLRITIFISQLLDNALNIVIVPIFRKVNRSHPALSKGLTELISVKPIRTLRHAR
jgi:hypothetical protein